MLMRKKILSTETVLKVASCVILCIQPVDAPGSLSLCVVYVKGHFMHLFVCKTCKSTRQLVFCVLNRICK